MINRQRRRALNIIRCFNNVMVLNLLKAEQEKIGIIKRKLSDADEPEFIQYVDDSIKILEGFDRNQTSNIELEWLVNAVESGQVTYRHFHQRLDTIHERLTKVID